jgi:hypothetical protein
VLGSCLAPVRQATAVESATTLRHEEVVLPSIADEVTPADGLGGILQPAHVRNEVKGGVDGSPDESFATNGGGDGCNRDNPTQPRHRPQHLARDPALTVLNRLPGNAHGLTSSKGHSGRVGSEVTITTESSSSSAVLRFEYPHPPSGLGTRTP